jgi:hypothetical protein
MHIAAVLLLALAPLFAPVLAPDPIIGAWNADLNASILPSGFPQLRSQRMELRMVSGKLQCSTERITLEGIKTHADFTAAFDGKRYAVTGLPEIATVSLHRYATFIEADFFSGSAPVFSYRMSLSSKDDTLIIKSIDPVTRAYLTAKIVYRRETAAR